tara:strand:- start:5504 stop:5689 length:186 start_codon:yes stop_codon:yes gene_type:complete
MITKSEVADYINANIETVLTSDEIKKLEDSIKNHGAKPLLVSTLIDLLGDVSILTGIRDDA